jgi:predicted TIM-barrel fold metal-dependent hydrolase
MNTLYDANTFIGHWPFRQVMNSTSVELQSLLESYNIKKALVANINAIFYKDAQCGNQELFELIGDNHTFYTGCAILNPTYAAWERDFEISIKEFNFKALRLVPQYHNYKIESDACIAICHKAVELNIPVIISPSMVDPRQKHWMDIDESISFKQICTLAENVNNLKIVCAGFTSNTANYDYQSTKDYHNRIFWDTSRCLKSAFYQSLAYGVNKLGVDQFLYGSNAPLRGISPSILELNCADISNTEKIIISSKNFDKLFIKNREK